MIWFNFFFTVFIAHITVLICLFFNPISLFIYPSYLLNYITYSSPHSLLYYHIILILSILISSIHSHYSYSYIYSHSISITFSIYSNSLILHSPLISIYISISQISFLTPFSIPITYAISIYSILLSSPSHPVVHTFHVSDSSNIILMIIHHLNVIHQILF